MSVTASVTGDGIDIERAVSDATVPQILKSSIDERNDEDDEESIVVRIEGDGISVERAVSVQRGLRVVRLVILDANEDGVANALDDEFETWDELPEGFFENLSDRQTALLDVLLDADGWVPDGEIAERITTEHGISVEGGRGVAGIIGGISKKYTGEFRRKVVPGREVGEHVEHRLGETFAEDVRAELR